MKKKITSFGIPAVVCFALAAVLLAGGMVGSTRAALSVYSDDYYSEIAVPSIGVALNETTETGVAQVVSSRYYTENGWAGQERSLLSRFSGNSAEKAVVGKEYKEDLTVTNKGTIPIYVRAYVYRYWTDEKGEKVQSLDPDLIYLTFGNGWIYDDSAKTEEREVLYCRLPLEPGGTSASLVKSFHIKNDVFTKVKQGKNGLEYLYEGKHFNLKVEVDAVQKDNIVDAAKAAWSKTVTVDASGALTGVE